MSKRLDNLLATRYNRRVDQVLQDSTSELKSTNTGLPERPAFEWDADRLLCVALDAEGRYTTTELAMSAGVNNDTIRRWRKHPDWAAAKQRILDDFAERFIAGTMASKSERVVRAAARLEQINRVIEERAASADVDQAQAAGVAYDADLASAPGGGTGLVVKRERIIGAGAAAQQIVEFEVDTGLIAAEAALSRQIAQEQGQWTEKTESTTNHKLYIGINLDDM